MTGRTSVAQAGHRKCFDFDHRCEWYEQNQVFIVTFQRFTAFLSFLVAFKRHQPSLFVRRVQHTNIVFVDQSIQRFQSARCEQQVELVEEIEAQDCAEYKVKAMKFQRVQSITMYFHGVFDDDVMQLTYIGFRGQFDQKITRQAVIATYEARPMIEDHKVDAKNQMKEGM